MIFWILAWLLVDFRPIYYTLVFIWMIAGGTFMAVPIAFWLVGVVVNNDKLEGPLLWQFTTQSVMWVAHIVIHIVFMDGLALWTGAPADTCPAG